MYLTAVDHFKVSRVEAYRIVNPMFRLQFCRPTKRSDSSWTGSWKTSNKITVAVCSSRTRVLNFPIKCRHNRFHSFVVPATDFISPSTAAPPTEKQKLNKWPHPVPRKVRKTPERTRSIRLSAPSRILLMSPACLTGWIRKSTSIQRLRITATTLRCEWTLGKEGFRREGD